MQGDRPELRPLGIGEMVDAAIRLYRTNFLTLIKISASVLVPIGVLQLIATAAVGPVDVIAFVPDPNATPEEVFEPLIPIYSTLGTFALLSVIGSTLVQGASITALSQVFQGIRPDWRDSLRVGAGRLVALVVSTLVLAVVSGVGLILCLVPGVFIFTMWSVSPVALMAERRGPLDALSRSYRLVKGRFWPVFGTIVLAYLLYMVANQIISTATTVVTMFGAANSGFLSFTPTVVGSAVVSVVATPFLAAMITILYFDLRVRKEGYDLQVMAADLAQMEADETAPPDADEDPFGLGSPGDR